MTRVLPEPQVEGRVLSIAGLDPSAGAGLLADIKTINNHNCYATGVITAQTVQNTLGVSAVVPVDGKLMQNQINAVLDDMGVNAIKIGMMCDQTIVNHIVNVLSSRDENYKLVVDPVIKSSSGKELINKAGLKALVEKLLPIATIVTPNILEAELLADMKISSVEEMQKAASIIQSLGVENVLVTGGHLQGQDVVDVLRTKSGEVLFEDKKLNAPNNHGTGCALSSSIACYLSKGSSIEKAVEQARVYVNNAIKSADNIGKGNGPINHIYS